MKIKLKILKGQYLWLEFNIILVSWWIDENKIKNLEGSVLVTWI